MMEIPLVTPDETLRTTMQKINQEGYGLAFVVDKDSRLAGIVTDGDIRRAILSGESLQSDIGDIMNTKPITAKSDWTEEELRRFLSNPSLRNRIPKLRPLIVPVLDDKGRIARVEVVQSSTGPRAISQAKSLENLRMPRRVLVLGGAGYIGSVLVRMLLEEDYEVKVMDNLVYGDKGIRDLHEHERFSLFIGDITNIVDIVEAASDVDAIIDLAAIVGDPASKMKPKQTLQVNYFSTNALVNIAQYLGVPRLIFASTCSVYGFKTHMVSENEPPNPLSLYAETKLMSERAILDNVSPGFCPTVLRFATVYGISPRMRFDLVANLLVAKAVLDGEITVYGKGEQKRPFVHVRDIARAIIRVLEASTDTVCNEIFNVGSEGQNMSIMELAKTIKAEIPSASIRTIEEKEDDRSYLVSFDKLKDILGFEPKERFSESVQEIQKLIEDQRITDYREREYSNYRSLQET